MSNDMDENENSLVIRRAVFGKQVDGFISSDIGRYIIERANDLHRNALAALKTCDAEDPKAVRKHQGDAAIASNIVQWLEDAVADGVQALNILDDRE